MKKEVSRQEAKKAYCNGVDVYAIKDGKLCRIPPSYLYSSGAPASELFHRSLPYYNYKDKLYIDQ